MDFPLESVENNGFSESLGRGTSRGTHRHTKNTKAGTHQFQKMANCESRPSKIPYKSNNSISPFSQKLINLKFSLFSYPYFLVCCYDMISVWKIFCYKYSYFFYRQFFNFYLENRFWLMINGTRRNENFSTASTMWCYSFSRSCTWMIDWFGALSEDKCYSNATFGRSLSNSRSTYKFNERGRTLSTHVDSDFAGMSLSPLKC